MQPRNFSEEKDSSTESPKEQGTNDHFSAPAWTVRNETQGSHFHPPTNEVSESYDQSSTQPSNPTKKLRPKRKKKPKPKKEVTLSADAPVFEPHNQSSANQNSTKLTELKELDDEQKVISELNNMAFHNRKLDKPQQKNQKKESAQTGSAQKPNKKQNKTEHGHTFRKVLLKRPTDECMLCCQISDIFGVGVCNHPACVECIIRMRCLGGSTDCHACRVKVPLMYFVQKPENWETFKLPETKVDHSDCGKFDIVFESQHAVDVYNDLNEFSCRVCRKQKKFSIFPTFGALKQHMGSEHDLFYCHICIDHLNILPKNHKTFSRDDLKLHMIGKCTKKVGGIKGHPQCKLCSLHLFDDEELYKHSRKDHFYCSVCSNEFGKNMFYKRIADLHFHYKQDHFPCLNPECVELGIVFKDEFDLDIHKTESHSERNRQIPIGFQYSNNQTQRNEPSTRVIPRRNAIIVPRPVQQPVVVKKSEESILSSNEPKVTNECSNWRMQDSVPQRNTKPFVPLRGPTVLSTTSQKNPLNNIKSAVRVKKAPPISSKPREPRPDHLKVIPSLDVWTENMRLKLEARNQGLPEPPDIEPKMPSVPVDTKQKKKHKDKHVIKAEAMEKRSVESATLSSYGAASKFDVLPDDE